MTLPIPNQAFADFRNQKTSGITSIPFTIFESDDYLNNINQIVSFSSLINSIIITNTSDIVIKVSCYVLDNTTTASDLTTYYIVKNYLIVASENVELLKKDIILMSNDSIVLTCESADFSCDAIVSYQVFLQ